jgi:hypothetical protein
LSFSSSSSSSSSSSVFDSFFLLADGEDDLDALFLEEDLEVLPALILNAKRNT